MRIFVLSVGVAIILGASAAYVLSTFQESIANAYVGSSVRLDQQERVNIYGREG